jgi:nucleotide-binding universal stress UspA family protein
MGYILVGLDGSERAPGVLKAAVDLARPGGHKLVLFRSFGLPPEMPIDVWKLEQGSLIETLRSHALEYLEACASNVPKDLLAEVRVEVGVPWQSACTIAKEMHANLIVVGSHGYSAFDRLLGTTAAKIVNHAECSVLVVRASPPA